MATKTQKAKPDTGKGQAFSTVCMFDDANTDAPNVRFKHEGIAFADVPPLTLADYHPRGGTPLYDATVEVVHKLDAAFEAKPDGVHFGFIIDESGSMGGNEQAVVAGFNEFVGAMADATADDGEGRVMVVILTDGMENSSKTSQAEVQGLIKEREAAGWTFLYLGANHDAWSGAGGLGISKAGSAMHFTSSATGTSNAMRSAVNRGIGYLADSGSYANLAAQAPMDIPEDQAVGFGTVPGTANPAPQSFTPKNTAYDPTEAIRKALGDKGGNES